MMQMKILLIDEPVNIDELKSKCDASGYEITIASTDQEISASLNPHPPDIIIVNLISKFKEGSGLIQQFETGKLNFCLPLIAIVERTGVKIIENFKSVYDFLIHPFAPEDLVERVSWNLKKWTDLKKTMAAEEQRTPPEPAPTPPAEPVPGTACEPSSMQAPPTMQAPSTPASVSAPTPSPASPKPKSDKVILLVEDDPELSETLKVRLESADYLVRCVKNGEEAVAAIRIKKPALIIMDVMMPKLDGYSALKQINKLTDRKVPVIIMTGTAAVSEEDYGMEGASTFLRKPIKGEELIMHVKDIIGEP
jgi:DNA-binding response OmpR family regulator